MSNIRIRPVTIGLVLIAVVLVAIGVVYFTKTAADLPSFFPGHAAHSTKHHVKHGVAMLLLALVVLAGAWFTTAPGRDARPPG
jgi:amino acid permease